jgi:neutral amino acid transport system permease protein
MVGTGLANAIVTGIVTGSIVALGAIGLALVYSIAEVPNFAHGELLMIGAYLALLVNQPTQVPVFKDLTTGPQALTATGMAILFVLSAVGTLGVIYLLGGVPALQGSWWPTSPPPAVAIGAHVLGAAAVGGLVAFGFPSILAAVLFSAIMLAVVAPFLERRIFRKFRNKGATLATMLIVTLGLSFVLRFGNQAFFGGNPRNYQIPNVGTVLGQDVVLSAARYFDFYVHGGGLVVDVLDTAVAGNPRLFLASYSWPVLVGIVVATLGVGVGVYRLRQTGGYGASQTFGPVVTGVVAAVAALVALLYALAGSAAVPDDPITTTRISLSMVRGGVILIALLMMASLHILLQETKLGTAMRASSDNKDLARITGINTDQVMMSTWIIAGAFAAVGGVMLGILFSTVRINMGFFLLLPMFAGVILGGIGSVYGAILGSFLVGVAMDTGIYLFDIGAVYRVPVAFVVLFVVLLVKPEGIIGGN